MRILVIEDEHKIANAIKRGLEQESYAVDVEYDADDGLAAAINSQYDCIILDRMLPGEIDGLEVCKKLRAKKNHTPVLMLTAKDSVSDKVEGLNSGADDYLVKPFAFQELLARLRSLLRRPHDAKDTILQVEDLTLDPVRFEVKRGDKTIALSRKEFSLLEYLMRNPGRLLSKSSIIEHVWNFDSDILPNTVEVYVGYLRGKIDRPFAKKPALIHTVRGFGYKIGA
jgi:DNA-binding response OmpR family regulator